MKKLNPFGLSKKFFGFMSICIFNLFFINAQISLTSTSGTTTGTYTTISAAFAAINNGTHQGSITINVVGNTTEPAIVTALLRSANLSNYTSLLIRPLGGNWVINSAASPTAQRGVIELAGADNVTIDGDDPNTSGVRNLTIQANTTNNLGVAALRLSSNSSTGADGATNITIKNCIIIGPRSSATSVITSYGINMSDYSTTSMTTGAYSNINTLIDNNEIKRCYTGIYAKGTSNLYPNLGLKILNNIIGSSIASENIGLRGILVDYSSTSSGSNSALIEGNDIRVGDVSPLGIGFTANATGIELGTVNSGIQILRNNIHDILQPFATTAYGAYGINITGAASCDNFLIANNFINNIVATKGSTAVNQPAAFGIRVNAGATFMRIVHNSIVLNAAQVGSVLNYTNYGIATSASTPSISELKNNIIINNNIGSGSYGIYLTSNGSLFAGASDNNNFYVSNGNVGFYSSTNQNSLSAWKIASGQDGNSISSNVAFLSASDLHVDINSQSNVLIDGSGASGTNINIDFDLQTRASVPDIGADEFILANCNGTPVIQSAILTPSVVCSGGSVNMSGSISVPASGYSYQWQSSPSLTGPFTNIPNATSSTYSSTVTSTTYFKLVATCSFSGLSSSSSVLTASVNPNPNITLVASNNGIFCGAGTQTITASGANTYSWSPSSSLNTSTGSTVASTASTSVTYSVLGTNTTTGCFSSQTITVGPPSITINSSVPNFCGNGGTFSMSASSIDPNMAYSWTKLTSSANLFTGSGSNVFASISETSNFQIIGTGGGIYSGCTSLAYFSIGVYPLPTATVTATPDAICSGGSTFINTGLSSVNFSSNCITPSALNIPVNAEYLVNNGNTSIPLTSGSLDDGGWGNIPLGFSFNFFGSNYTSLNVGTNGVIQFGPYNSTALNDYTIGALPNTVDPLGAIFLAASDLDCSVGGSPATYIRYWTEGYAPNRKFVIEYNVYQWNSVSNRVNVQAILYETLGSIDVIAKEVTSSYPKSIGVNSPNGLIGAAAPNCQSIPIIPNYWSAQTGTITSNAPQGWRFVPPSNFNLVWNATDVNGTTTIASGINIFSQNSSPAINTLYDISFTNQSTGCSNLPGSAQVQMNVLSNVAPSGLNAISSKTLVCGSSSFDLSTSYSGSTTGLNFQWQSSSDGGVTWNYISNANTPTVSINQTLTTEYRCEVSSCGGLPVLTTSVLVNTQTPPAISASSSSLVYCGQVNNPVTLNAIGTGVIYKWVPIQGLSDSVGVSVSATPSASTVYTVTAFDSLGCTNSATLSIGSFAPLEIDSISATPSSICAGSGSVLYAKSKNATAPQGYCQPYYASGTGAGDYISLVQLATINNQTGGSQAPFYTMYSASGPTTTTLTAGNTYTLTLQAGTYTANDLAAFIDYNQNVTLNDPGEKLGETNDLGPAPAQTTFVFTVPLNALNGLTVLRVRELDSLGVNYITPCSTLSAFGEVEDYIITIVGGVDPVFNYSWSPTNLISNPNSQSANVNSLLNTTDFIVTATSLNGCQVIDTVAITVLSSPTAPTSPDTTVCSGISLVLNATGSGSITWYDAPINGNLLGTGSSFTTSFLNNSISYWAQDSVPGSCPSVREQVDVNVLASPQVSLGSDITQCGGSTTLDAQNLGSTFLWSNQQTSQSIVVNTSGLYTVIVTNPFGCAGYDSININIFSQPILNLGSDTSYCANQFSLDAQNPGSQYQWNTGDTTQSVNVFGSGSYDVTVITNEGCIGYDTINLTLYPTPIVNLGNDTLVCNGNLILDAQNSGSTYLWNDNSIFPILLVNTSGTYWVDVTNSQNCTTRDSIFVTIDPCLTLNSYNTNGFLIYPNPNAGIFYVESTGNTGKVSVEVFDSQGKLIFNKTFESFIREKVELTTHENGIYLLKISQSDIVTLARLLINE